MTFVLLTVLVALVVKSSASVPSTASDASKAHAGNIAVGNGIVDVGVDNIPDEVSVAVTDAVSGHCGLSTGTHKIGDRDFELYIPSAAKANAPLMLVWHGIASDPSLIESKMNYKKIADDEGWILAYPVGTGFPKAFNGAGCCASSSIGQTRDDLQFAKDIIDHIDGSSKDCINPANVFSTGFSNGGFMCQKLACEAGYRSDAAHNADGTVPWFKAIGTHSGLMGSTYSCPHASGFTPFITFHADDDKIVGIDGSNNLGLSFKSLFQVTEKWRINGQCSSDFTTDTYGSSTTTCTQWKGCDVETCEVTGGLGHNWSGDPLNNRPDDLDASRHIVDFFKRVAGLP